MCCVYRTGNVQSVHRGSAWSMARGGLPEGRGESYRRAARAIQVRYSLIRSLTTHILVPLLHVDVKNSRVHHSVGSAQKRHKIYPNGKFPFSFPFECMQCSPPGQVAFVRPPSLALLARSVAIQPCDVLVPGGGPCIQGGQDVAACARSVAIRCETWPVEGLRHPEPSSVASQSSDQGIAGQCGSCLRTR